MEITEIRIKLMDDSEDRLRAFCSITFDNSFVVRDLKIIEGNSGPFVAMPSRKLTAHCRECRFKNYLRARFCNQCGCRLPDDQVDFDAQGRAKLYADVAHPINAECREVIQEQVIQEFETELERAKQPGYFSRYDDSYESDSTTQRRATPDRPQVGRGTGVIERMDSSEQDVPSPHPLDSPTTERGPKSNPQGSAEQNFGSQSNFGKGILD